VKVILKHVLVMLLLAPRALVWGASDEATWGNGLEADNTTQLVVLIEELSEKAKNIGLARERIEARVNQLLRKAGITPVPADPKDDRVSVVYVNVNVVASGSFTISIFFERRIFYRSGDRWFTTLGITWNRSGTGIAHSNADYILDRIAEHVEVFCNEFLKANGK
jgi:hypothetical protein